jgi:hypothetical protein
MLCGCAALFAVELRFTLAGLKNLRGYAAAVKLCVSRAAAKPQDISGTVIGKAQLFRK